MPHTNARARIYYETRGAETGEPLVLIEGLGAQLIGWREGFIDCLVARGMHVILLDNRDVGLSDKFGEPHQLEAAYSLGDMAADACSVLDALGLASAHIVGQSMGGAIAQIMAIEHPARVRSMTLFYTVPAFSPKFLTEEVLARVAAASAIPPATGREAAIEAHVANERHAASTAYAFDEAWIREAAGLQYDRCYRPDGVQRQTAAVLGSGDRSPQLAGLAVPTAIIHGRADRLLKYQASIAIARLIESAELHLYPGMGHQVVQPLWEEFAAIIARTAGRARRSA